MASKKAAKVAKVMREYKTGKLKSSSGRKVTDIKQAIAIAMSEAEYEKHKRSEDGRKQSRMKDRNHDLYNAYAEQEYTKPNRKKYDTATGPNNELTGPDTYRAGKYGARVQTGVLRQPLKGSGRRPKIKKPLYRGSPNNRREYKDRWSGV